MVAAGSSRRYASIQEHAMQTLYPEIKPYARHELAVQEPHVLYVDESGSPDGLPVVFIHGGPGAGCDAASRRYFDPNLYRIVTFDQRGCGRSTPHASLENNTTQALIADMDQIPADERGNLMQAFYKRLTGPDQIAQMHAAKAWSTSEGRTATLRPNPQVVD